MLNSANIDVNQLLTIVPVLSLASERITQVFKPVIEELSVSNRQLAIYFISSVSGGLICYFFTQMSWQSSMLAGVVTCAGSGLLHDLFGIVTQIKDNKQV